MAEAILVGGGGGGADLDLVTARAGDVAKGKVIVDSSWDPVTGTLELTGNATDAHVLNGATYYNNNLYTKRTGTMPQRSVSDSALNCGQSRTMEYGYYPGGFTVRANSLASQTSGDATAAQITSGKVAWVNGNRIVGSMSVQSILSFSAAPSGFNKITCTWVNPQRGPFAGVIIKCNDTEVYRGYGNNANAGGTSSVTIDLSSYAGRLVEIDCYSYAVIDGSVVTAGTSMGAIDIPVTSEKYIYTLSGTFRVPSNVSSIDIFCVGGGGGGGGSKRWGGEFGSGGGGSGGEVKVLLNHPVTPNEIYKIVIGGGGSAGPLNSHQGYDGRYPPGHGDGGKGGDTEVSKSDGTSILLARGGWFGRGGWVYSNWNQTSRAMGGDGGCPDIYINIGSAESITTGYWAGSGGGGGSVWSRPSDETSTGNVAGGQGGSDGKRGTAGKRVAAGIEPGTGGYGQAYTYPHNVGDYDVQNATRLFQEENGELYAGGGGGGCCGNSCYDGKQDYIGYGGAGGGGNSPVYGNGSNGSPGTGGGGGGGAVPEGASGFTGGAGGSGIVIIRPHLK